MTANPPVSIPSADQAAAQRRFHVHMSVADLAGNIRFYTALFGAQPTVVKDDYAKWMLDDPRVNFAISTRGDAVGVEHLGIQVESDEALVKIRDQAAAADLSTVAEIGTSCCYAKSDKYWLEDPQGVAWETFHSLDSIPTFSGGESAAADGSACCVPTGAAESSSQSCAPDVSACAPAKPGCC